jgi:hypothetical protein
VPGEEEFDGRIKTGKRLGNRTYFRLVHMLINCGGIEVMPGENDFYFDLGD